MVHLHTHTDYSVLDSIVKIPDLVEKAKKLGHGAVAITDHGSLGGLVEFHKECRKKKIKPILGCELYHTTGDSKTNYHLTVLAKNEVGFKNLIKLNNLSIQNFYRKPRITDENLIECAEGLIVLSGCMIGYLGQSIVKGEFDKSWYYKMKDEMQFVLEVQDCGLAEQTQIKHYFEDNKLHYINTRDVHYLDRDDRKAHDVLYAVMSHKPLGTYSLDGDYSYCGMEDTQTDLIAEEVEEYEIANPKWYMPDVEIDKDKLRWQLMKKLPQGIEYIERFDYEWDVIWDNGFMPYFMIVSDLCKHFDDEGKFRGWGRGSASGSLISYLLGITKIDPIQWNLHFERFLNPDRISPPDIDLDFTPEDRNEAIEYMSKWGSFVKIGSYGTFGTKDAINTASKILGIYTDLASYVPNEAPVPTIRELMETRAFKKQVDKEGNQDFINVCLRLEGVKKSLSIHASGIVDSKDIPLRISKKEISTSWDMYSLEDMRRIKFDILGVNNLGIIDRVCKKIHYRVEEFPLDDKKTFDLINQGITVGVFQWESTGYVNIIKRLHPDTFDELIDLNTLYRPGCLESGLTDEYIERKHGRRPIKQLHAKLDMKRKGLPLFQEDIMTLAKELAGFTGGEADILRKAIGKKQRMLLATMKGKFIQGCKVTGANGEELWEMIEKFGRYTWNLSHAVAYTLISWWTAYLSANYPLEFFCELLNSSDSSKHTILLNECRKRGLELDYPDMTASDRGYAVRYGKILIGFMGIKYLGEKTVDKIIEGQPYFNKEDFINRSKVNKRVVEVLDKIGLFNDKVLLEDEREYLGYYVKKRQIDTIWWREYANLGEVIDVHKKTTKRGDPMAFLTVDFADEVKQVTVFPDVWSRIKFKDGDIGIFNIDDRGVLRGYVKDIDSFKVEISASMKFGFNTSFPNIYYKSAPMGAVDMTEEVLKQLEKIGIERIF